MSKKTKNLLWFLGFTKMIFWSLYFNYNIKPITLIFLINFEYEK